MTVTLYKKTIIGKSQKLHPIIVQVYFTISRAEICESGNRYFSEPSGGVRDRGANTSNSGVQASPVALFPWTKNFSPPFLSSPTLAPEVHSQNT